MAGFRRLRDVCDHWADRCLRLDGGMLHGKHARDRCKHLAPKICRSSTSCAPRICRAAR